MSSDKLHIVAYVKSRCKTNEHCKETLYAKTDKLELTKRTSEKFAQLKANKK